MSRFLLGIALLGDELGSSGLELDRECPTGHERLLLLVLCQPRSAPTILGEGHIHYFCGNTEIPQDLKDREPQRTQLYKATVALVWSFANIKDDLEAARYTPSDISRIKKSVNQYLSLRETIRNASGESLDLKAYEADMRHLIDTYIEADRPRIISPFGEMSLLELIVKTGIGKAVDSLPDGIRSSKEAVAETIENNVRKKIIKEHLNDPAYYEKMSALLDEIIATRKANAIEYEEYT
jgi:type I restriction enzyme R subunit